MQSIIISNIPLPVDATDLDVLISLFDGNVLDVSKRAPDGVMAFHVSDAAAARDAVRGFNGYTINGTRLRAQRKQPFEVNALTLAVQEDEA